MENVDLAEMSVLTGVTHGDPTSPPTPISSDPGSGDLFWSYLIKQLPSILMIFNCGKDKYVRTLINVLLQ